MRTNIDPSDITRAVSRIDVNASAGPNDIPPTNNPNGHTMVQLCVIVGAALAYRMSCAGIAHHSLTLSHTLPALAAHGMSSFGLTQWGSEIHARMVADYSVGGWGTQNVDSLSAIAVVWDADDE